MWNESFQFDVHVPDLAMVRFVVEDYDSTSQNDLVGQYCLPITSVQSGEELVFNTDFVNWYFKCASMTLKYRRAAALNFPVVTDNFSWIS